MVQTIQVKDITLRDLVAIYGIELVEDEHFFREWEDELPEVTDLDKQLFH